jgi:GntR family transcriptional repressor for pyruvate dehydrogenase complex
VGAKLDLSLCHDKLYKQVADQIEALIVGEALSPGDKLPSERELAAQLGISRTVVREAIRLLSVRGLVRVKAGCGTYVQKPTPTDAAASIELLLKLERCPDSFDDFFEVRTMIEIEVAGRAAERAGDDDLVALERTISEMAAHVDDLERFVQHDLAFRQALAAATQNDIFCVLLSAVSGFLLKMGRLAHQAPGAAEIALDHYREVLRRVRKQDPEGARRAMYDHICHSQRLVEALRTQADVRL